MSAGQPPTDPRLTGTGSPFEAQPRDLPAPRQGCSRMALIGCAVAILLIGLGVLTLMMKASDIVGWSLTQIRGEIERTLPDDLPAEESARLGRAFDAVTERLDSGELDALAFQELQTELMRFARLGRAPTREEVADLSAALERFAGLESPDVEAPDVETEPRGDDASAPDPSAPDATAPDGG